MHAMIQASGRPSTSAGDIVTFDAEGYMRITDRSKDVIKSGGEWISSVELENALMGHPAVKEAAVVGVVDSQGLTKPHAFVIANRTPGLDEELKAFVRERLEPYKAPREVVFLDDFPRTHLGKVDRGKLRGLRTEDR